MDAKADLRHIGHAQNIGAEFLQNHRGLPGALNSHYLARHGETAWSLRAQDTGLRISRWPTSTPCCRIRN